jgi:hypothetical protein
MRISFDVDDTLVCGPSVPVEQVIPCWRRWQYREGLRRGTQSLMMALLKRRCQIWVYTTSYRSVSYLRGWFIENYGIIGKMRTAALVGMNGSIDWNWSVGQALSQNPLVRSDRSIVGADASAFGWQQSANAYSVVSVSSFSASRSHEPARRAIRGHYEQGNNPLPPSRAARTGPH